MLMACKCHPDPTEIRITLDGDKWCALRGENLQEGESGIGDSPEEALCNLLRLAKRTDEYNAIRAAVHLECGYPGTACETCPFIIEDQCLRHNIRELLSGNYVTPLTKRSTRDLVNELRSRKDVEEYQVAPGDIYQVKTLDGQKKDRDVIRRGPARILVVID